MELQSKRKLDNEGEEVTCLKLDNEDEHAVSGSSKGIIRVFNLWSGKQINKIYGNDKYCPIQNIQFKKNQKYQLLSASCDGTIKLSHILTTKSIYEFKEEDNNQILSMDLLDEQFITAGIDHTIRVYDEETQQVVQRLKHEKYVQNSHNNRIFQVKFINNNSVISGGNDRNVIIWDLRSGKISQSMSGPFIIGSQIDFYQNYLAIGSNTIQDALYIYDIRNINKKFKDLNKDLSSQESSHFKDINMVFSVGFSKNNKNITSLQVTAFDQVMLYDVNSDFKPFAQIYQFDGSSYCQDSGNFSDKFVFGSSLGVVYYLNLVKNQ